MALNVKAINRLADVIASGDYAFDMSVADIASKLDKNHRTCQRFCGTPGCIGGTAAAIWPSVRRKTSWNRTSWEPERLAKKLGITEAEENRLTFPKGFFEGAPKGKRKINIITFGYNNLTREGAVKTLRRLAKTGKVVWRYKEHVKSKVLDALIADGLDLSK